MPHMMVAQLEDILAPRENPLRLFRRQRGWTQPRLAEECSVSTSMISQIECGYVIPSLQVAFRISQCTGITLERLARFCLREPSAVTSALVTDLSARRKAIEKLRS